MTTKLLSLAMADTPEAVSVPKDWRALVIWAVGRFGVGILVAIVFYHAWREERLDSRQREERYIVTLETRAKVDVEMSAALAALRHAIDQLRVEAGSAHKLK